MNIRNSLRALILVTLFPVAVFGIGGAYHLVKKQRATLERAIEGRSRALMTAIQSELQATRLRATSGAFRQRQESA